MNPQEKIQELEQRIIQLEKALAIVNLQVNQRQSTNRDARAMGYAFDSGRHFFLEVTPVAESEVSASSSMHRKALRLCIDEPQAALAKSDGKR